MGNKSRKRPRYQQRDEVKPIRPDEFEPVRIDTTAPAEERKYVPLFYIDEKEYTVPATFPPAIGLRYLGNLRDESGDFATAELLTEVLGRDGFDDLSQCDSISPDQMDRIIEIIIGLAMGSVDRGKD